MMMVYLSYTPFQFWKNVFFLTGQNIKIFAQNLDPEFTFE